MKCFELWSLIFGGLTAIGSLLGGFGVFWGVVSAMPKTVRYITDKSTFYSQLDVLRNKMKKNPKGISKLITEGDRYAKNDDWDEASALYAIARKLDPTNIEAVGKWQETFDKWIHS